MDINDQVLAWANESEWSDLRLLFEKLNGRHTSERVETAWRLSQSGNRSGARPFRRGRMKASELPETSGETDRIWFGLYPGSLVYLCGETGAGKSSVLYNVVIHAARNEPLWAIPFGRKRPIKVLYVDPENSGNFDDGRPGLCLEKVLRIGQGRPELLEFQDGQGVNLSLPDHMDDLEQIIKEEGFELIILDPIINLFGTKDENDNAEAGNQFTLLKSLAKRTNCCIVAIHHTGRDGSGIFGRGATARLGAADVGLILRVRGEQEDLDDDYGTGVLRDRDDKVRLQMVKNRIEPGKASIFLQMDGQDRFSRVGFSEWKSAGRGSERPAKKVVAEEEIYTFLLDNERYTADAIITAMAKEEIGQNSVRSALAKLVKEGILTSSREGIGGKTFYQMAPAQPTDTQDGSLIVSRSPIGDHQTIKLPNMSFLPDEEEL